MDDVSDRRARGLAVYKKMGWGDNPVLREIDPELWQLTTDLMFADIWSRGGLTLREREMVVLAALITIGTDGVALHMRHAHNLGITDEEIREIIFQVMYYAGLPKANFAMKRFKEVLSERETDSPVTAPGE